MDLFLYTVDATVDEPIMLINKFIGFDSELGYGIMGDIFQKELLALDEMGKKSIKVYINSPGGSVIDGYSIYSAILKSKTNVDTYCIGMAASIAGVIFQAGRNRVMADYGKLMYHDPYTTNDDGSKKSNGLEPILDSIATMIASRTGKTDDEIKGIMSKETWIGADEALENGFCDKIENSGKINAKRKINNREDVMIFWKDADKVLNSIFNIKDKTPMKELLEINNKLGLNPEASTSATVEEINRIINKAKDAEKAATDAKAALKDKEKELEQKEEDCKNLKAEIDKMKNEKAEEDKKAKEKEEKEATDKAKNYVEGLVKAGKLKNDATIIEATVAKFVVDFDGMKNLFESMPINKTAAKIDVSPSSVNAGPKGSVIGAVMAKNLAKV
jgi:ATP-dependent Clp protease protease subunit